MRISQNHLFKLLITTLLLFGVFFRFASLGERPYWHDEAHTLIRSSGYTIAEITAQIFNGQLLDRDQVLKFQHLPPDKTNLDVIRSLAAEEPHRAPLFYLIAHNWMRWFGNSLTAMRGLPSLISLLVFPAMYWLCSELFTLPLTGWIAIALVSVSPFQVYYAQELREYALWTVTTLLTSAAYLRAIRSSNWKLYTLSIILSLYTSLLSLLIWLGHFIHAIVSQKQIKPFLNASLLSLMAYSPLPILVMINLVQVERTSAWMFKPTPIQNVIHQWIANYQFIFLKTSLTGSLSFVFTIAITLLIFFATRSLILSAKTSSWVLIALLVLPLLLTFVIPDLVLGGLRSTNGRYFVPCYLGIQLAVAHLLAIQHSTRVRQAYWRFVFIAILTAGVLSCSAQIVQNRMSEDLAIAALINRSENAIVISAEESYQGGGTIGDILTLSHLVKPGTKFQLVIQPQTPDINVTQSLYLFKPLPYLKKQFQGTYRLEAIYKDKLFRILPK